MTPWIRRTLWSLGGIAALGAAAAFGAIHLGDAKRMRVVNLPPLNTATLTFRSDPGTIERGRYLFASRGCVDCHGANGAGRKAIDDGGLLVIGPNLTSGARGVTAHYTPAHWDRALRHGVKPDGRPVMVMPSEDYAGLTDDDLMAIASYVRQLPPVDGLAARMDLPPPVRALYGLGMVQDAAEKIDHRRMPAVPVAAAVSQAHGRYVAQMCLGCHGAGLSGGKIPGAPPAWPAAANLTPGDGSVMPRYASAEAFIAMLREGRRPDGSAIQVMPFESLRELNDTDARALYLYLRSVPARPAGQR